MRTPIAALIALAISSPATAQQMCGERDQIVAALQAQFGETASDTALQETGNVVEVYRNRESGTWTILVTLPNGMTCLVAAGSAWEHLPDPDPGDPA